MDVSVQRDIDRLNTYLVNSWPEIFTQDIIKDPTKLSVEKVGEIAAEGFILFCLPESMNPVVHHHFSHYINLFDSIQKIGQREYMNHWKTRILSAKENITLLKELQLEFKHDWILDAKSYSVNGSFGVGSPRGLIWKNYFVLKNYETNNSIETVFDLYIKSSDDNLTKSEIEITTPDKIYEVDKPRFTWKGDKIDFLEVMRALKLSNRLTRNDGSKVTNNDIIELFTSIKFEKTGNPPTTKELEDEVPKSFKKEKRATFKKFYLAELCELLLQETERLKQKN